MLKQSGDVFRKGEILITAGLDAVPDELLLRPPDQPAYPGPGFPGLSPRLDCRVVELLVGPVTGRGPDVVPRPIILCRRCCLAGVDWS